MLKGNKQVFLAIVFLVLGLLNLVGCSQKAIVEDDHPAPAVEETEPSPVSPSPNTAPAAGALTQQEAVELFVHNLGYKIVMDSGANHDLQLPASFTEVKHGVRIGELLKDRNELSKQNGLDFSGYLGKQVSLYTYAVEDGNGVVSNIDLVVDGNKVIGFWIDNNTKRDNNTKPPDFNVIVGAYEANSPK